MLEMAIHVQTICNQKRRLTIYTLLLSSSNLYCIK